MFYYKTDGIFKFILKSETGSVSPVHLVIMARAGWHVNCAGVTSTVDVHNFCENYTLPNSRFAAE